MSRFLELKRTFQPSYHRAGAWGFMPWDTNFYYRDSSDRNHRSRPRTIIPGNLQPRLKNNPRAVANGYAYNDRWVSKWKRLTRKRLRYFDRVVRHE